MPSRPERAISLFYIPVETRIFVAGDNAVEKSLLMATSALMTSEQAASNSETLNPVVVAQNVRNPCAQFLNFSHR